MHSIIMAMVFTSSLLTGTTFKTSEDFFGKWVHLGERTVQKGGDRDEILAADNGGTFRALQLRVRNSPIQLTKVRVVFANGQDLNVNINKLIPAGGETRVLDLPGGDRKVIKVVLHYRTKARARGRALVQLYGRR